jgi:hypothetical protein
LQRIDDGLLAPPHCRRHPADDRASGHGDQRIAGVDRPRQMGRTVLLDRDDLDSLCLERGHESPVLLADERKIRRRARLPVPHSARIDERPRRFVPGVGAHDGPLVPRRAHEHRPQAADVIRRPPAPAPDPLELARIVKGRLGDGRAQAQVIAERLALQR